MIKEEIEKLLHDYNSTKEAIENLKKENQERNKQINKLFKPVVENARILLGEYLMIGSSGYFGVMMIKNLLTRYKNGERTYMLYKQLEELE